MAQPEINSIINELLAVAANLIKENAILKATISANQAELVRLKISEDQESRFLIKEDSPQK